MQCDRGLPYTKDPFLSCWGCLIWACYKPFCSICGHTKTGTRTVRALTEWMLLQSSSLRQAKSSWLRGLFLHKSGNLVSLSAFCQRQINIFPVTQKKPEKLWQNLISDFAGALKCLWHLGNSSLAAGTAGCTTQHSPSSVCCIVAAVPSSFRPHSWTMHHVGHQGAGKSDKVANYNRFHSVVSKYINSRSPHIGRNYSQDCVA